MKQHCQIFEKSSLNSCQAKKCQNSCIKALFETKKGHRTTFETLKYLQQTMFWHCLLNVKMEENASVKSSPKCCRFCGLLKKSFLGLSKRSPNGNSPQYGHIVTPVLPPSGLH
jgi:hypothetical protein